MKNLWLIAVVVFSFFACNEKKEQELTPIYADAFYEPDFIPYLMLKHGVDTIKVIDSAMQTTWKWKDKDSMLSSIFTFNRETKLSKFFPLAPMPNNEYAMFGEDSLLRYVTYGSCSPVCYEFEFKPTYTIINRIATSKNFYFNQNDSIIFIKEVNSKKSVFDTEFVLNDSKIIEILNGDFITVDSTKTKRIYKDNKLLQSISYNIHTSQGKIDSVVKTFFWNSNEIEKIKFVHHYSINEWHGTTNFGRLSFLYFNNELPTKRVYYLESDSIILNYQIIRNSK